MENCVILIWQAKVANGVVVRTSIEWEKPCGKKEKRGRLALGKQRQTKTRSTIEANVQLHQH